MPLTYDDTTKVITAEYIAGDPKGNSLANAWTVDDFDTAMTAVGHGDKWVQQGNQHSIQIKIKITGAGTYVHFYSASIEWVTGIIHTGNLLEVLNTANFQAGTADELPTTSAKCGCNFMINIGDYRCIYFDAYVKIYDSVFLSTISKVYSYQVLIRGYSASPTEIKRCIFQNSRTLLKNISNSNYDNIIYKNNISNGSLYGISLTAAISFPNVEGLTVIGKISDSKALDSTWDIRDINSPEGVLRIRTNVDGSMFRLYDCVYDKSKTEWDLPTLTDGATATLQRYSTFNFYCENGENAIIKVYDKDDLLILDSVLDASGELEDQGLMYQQIYYERIAGEFTLFDLDYEPLKVVITKAGRETLTIDGIYVVEGKSTNIYGTMVYPELIISAVEITDCSKIGIDNGELLITAEGGDTVYEYSLDGITYQASNKFTGLPHGNYTVYVKDGELTVATFDVTITEPISEPYFVDGEIKFNLTEDVIKFELQEEETIHINWV